MERPVSSNLAAVLGLALICVTATATPARAQGPNASASVQQPDPSRTPDFFFSRPRGSVGLRGGWTFATAGSDLFDFVTRQLTLEKKDFNAPGIGGDFTIALTPRADLEFGVDWQNRNLPSSYRSLVDNNFNEIEQFTRLKMITVGGSLRYALTARGHDVSRFAWVPRRVVPYVGAGGGIVRYDFMQSGDFVDFQNMGVFTDVFRAKGWSPAFHGFGGVDIRAFRAMYVSVEARYTNASGKLGQDFVDFDPIDLSGLKILSGVNVVF